MKVLILLFLMVSPVYSSPVVYHRDDYGGRIVDYLFQMFEWNTQGRMVVLDGHCASACTMFLSLENVCITERSIFSFHAATESISGLVSEEGTEVMREYLSRASQELVEWFDENAAHLAGNEYAKLSADELVQMNAARMCF